MFSKIADLIFLKTTSNSVSGSGKTSINFIKRGTFDRSLIIACRNSVNLFAEIIEKTSSMIGSSFNRLLAALDISAGRTKFSFSKRLQTTSIKSGTGFTNTRFVNAIPIL